jgi:predicted LPLAT superfamily acyltransferase
MPQWEGKSKGTPLGYSIFIGILKTGGVRPAYFLLRFVAFYYFLFARKSFKALWYYFRKRLGFGRMRSMGKIYRNYYLFGQALIDRVVLMSGIRNNFSFDFDGEEYLHEMVRNGKGGLLLSAHIGNWEIAGHLLKRLQTRINIVMFDGEHQKIKQYLEGVTGERNANIIVIKDDISHIYAITDALAKNELVCMHADRFMDNNKTMEAVFLHEKALFPAGPFVLATRLKAPVSFVFAMKENAMHYHFYATPAKEYTGSDKALLQQQILADFVAGMEQKVKAYPEQWYNYYPFWK